MRAVDYVWLLVVVILLVLLGLSQFREPRTIRIQARDTILVKEPIYIEAPAKIKYKTKVVFRADTVVVTDSTRWEACVDTLIQKTEIKACYLYPENTFWFYVYSKPDTVKVQSVEIFERPLLIREKEMPWFYVGLVGVGCFLFGTAIGQAAK